MAILLAMIPAFFWGTTYAVTQFSVPDWPPLMLGALRALPAGLLLLLLKPTWPQGKQWRQLLLLGSVNISAFFALIFVVALTLPSAISGIGMMSVPVFAMLFQIVVYRHKPQMTQLICGLILIALACLLFNPSQIELNPIGLLALFAAIFCIILGSDATKRLGVSMHWWQVLTWQLIIGGALLAIIAMVHAAFQPQQYIAAINQVNLRNISGLLWIAVLNTALGYGMYVWLLQRMSVVDFTFGGIANPIAGILLGVLLVGESYSLWQYSLMAGMILMSLLPQIIISINKQRQIN